MAILTASDIKAHLDIGHTDDDPRLANIAAQVSRDIARYTRRSFDSVPEAEEYLDGGGDTLIVPHLPIVEVTAITDQFDGAEVDLEDVDIKKAAGLLYRRSGGTRIMWAGKSGDGRYLVEYTHGYAAVPEDVKGIALALAATLYERPDLSETSRREGDLSTAYGAAWNEDVVRTLKPYRNVIV